MLFVSIIRFVIFASFFAKTFSVRNFGENGNYVSEGDFWEIFGNGKFLQDSMIFLRKIIFPEISARMGIMARIFLLFVFLL